ncbi:MAG: patatin-like phospholipase family protein [Methanococcaceae archaeon]
MNKYRILAIDGGGIRGIISAVILERINKETGFLDKTDMAAGTSTGGLIALAIANGINVSAIKDIYLQKGSYIFNDNWFDDLRDLFGLAGADYNCENLINVLKEIFGNASLKDLKKHVLVTAFDLDNNSADEDRRSWQPVYFTNFPFRNLCGQTGSEDLSDTPVYKAGYYTAAAPTYFPSLDGYIDGGIFASNPSMEALCMAPYGEPVLFSAGTGISLKHIEGDQLDWGYAQWLKPMAEMMMSGQQLSAHHQCSELLGKKYFRIAPVFPCDIKIDMDDVDKMDYMLKFAQDVNIDEAVKFVKEVWL